MMNVLLHVKLKRIDTVGSDQKVRFEYKCVFEATYGVTWPRGDV